MHLEAAASALQGAFLIEKQSLGHFRFQSYQFHFCNLFQKLITFLKP